MKAMILVLGLMFATGCATVKPTSTRTYEGAAVGAAAGGVAGALLDRQNPWRGGVIGAAIGAVAAGTLTEISVRASREAAQANQPVEYRTDDGRGVYRAQPARYNPHTRCRTIHEQVWEDGRLVTDSYKEICEETYGPAPPPVVVEQRTVYVPAPPTDRGPPPWAPAHGYRAKYRYYYYPASYVYYDTGRGLYFYIRNDRWEFAASLPREVHIQKTEYVVLEMATETPYHHHSEVKRKYPPGQEKKSRR